MSSSSAVLSLFVALCLGIAGCGRLPKPFKAEAGEGAESPLVALQDSAGVVVVPIFNAPPGVAGPLADIMAAEFRRADIPATTGSAIKNAYLLEGDATFLPGENGQGKVAVSWTVTDGQGTVVERLVTEEGASSAAWRSGARVGLDALAADAVPRIVEILKADVPSAAVTVRPTIGIVAVEGAPGDGNEALKRAFAAVLKGAGVPVAPEPKRAAIQVFGKVDVLPKPEGQEQIKIEWTLRKPDGSEIGVLKQNNTVENGQVAARWGPLAYDVTFAMIDTIADVLETMERAEDIRRRHLDDLKR